MIIIYNNETGLIYGADPNSPMSNPDLINFTNTKTNGSMIELDTTVPLKKMHEYIVDLKNLILVKK